MTVDVDLALMEAWELGMGDAGWSDEIEGRAEQVLPALIAAGYAATDADETRWWFTPAGVARAEELERLQAE